MSEQTNLMNQRDGPQLRLPGQARTDEEGWTEVKTEKKDTMTGNNNERADSRNSPKWYFVY